MLRTLKDLFWLSFRAEFFNVPQMLSQAVFFVMTLMECNCLWLEGANTALPIGVAPEAWFREELCSVP